MRRTWTVVLLIVFLASSSFGAEKEPIKHSSGDKCPVCGMFVAKYPDFLCQIIYKDGSYAVFDGAKDMFKYFLDMKRYAPSRNVSDVSSIYVTDYYSLVPVDGRKARYVIGSNIYGPMGKELIPFEKESDAHEFVIDHAGQSVLKFESVVNEIIKSLD